MTTQKKKESLLAYHKFELIKYFSELNDHQKKIEEELRLFNSEKGLKAIEDEENKLFVDRNDYKNGIFGQIFGFKQVVKDFKSQLGLFQQMVAENKVLESKQEWTHRKQEISSFLQCLKDDLIERENFLLSETIEASGISLENNTFEDNFIDNLPNDLPG